MFFYLENIKKKIINFKNNYIQNENSTKKMIIYISNQIQTIKKVIKQNNFC